MAAKVERYKIHDVRSSNHEDDDYEAYANGNALLISGDGDIEVYFSGVQKVITEILQLHQSIR